MELMKTKVSESTRYYSEDQRCSFNLTESTDDSVTVKTYGSINSDNAGYFQEQMEKLIDDGIKNIVFDMSDTEYVSAAGIGSFIHLFESVKKIGGSIVMNSMQSRVIEVFQLPGFADYFYKSINGNSAF